MATLCYCCDWQVADRSIPPTYCNDKCKYDDERFYHTVHLLRCGIYAPLYASVLKWTPLISAVMVNAPSSIIDQAAQQSNIDYRDRLGHSAYDYAILHDNKDAMEVITKHKTIDTAVTLSQLTLV